MDSLVDVGIACVPTELPTIASGPPYQGLPQEHRDMLTTARSILQAISTSPSVQKASKPLLYHPDLHACKIFVSEHDPTLVTDINRLAGHQHRAGLLARRRNTRLHASERRDICQDMCSIHRLLNPQTCGSAAHGRGHFPTLPILISHVERWHPCLPTRTGGDVGVLERNMMNYRAQ